MRFFRVWTDLNMVAYKMLRNAFILALESIVSFACFLIGVVMVVVTSPLVLFSYMFNGGKV